MHWIKVTDKTCLNHWYPNSSPKSLEIDYRAQCDINNAGVWYRKQRNSWLVDHCSAISVGIASVHSQTCNHWERKLFVLRDSMPGNGTRRPSTYQNEGNPHRYPPGLSLPCPLIPQSASSLAWKPNSRRRKLRGTLLESKSIPENPRRNPFSTALCRPS